MDSTGLEWVRKLLEADSATSIAAASGLLPEANATFIAIGTITSLVGAYLSYFLDGATGGVIVVLQTLVFLIAFVFAPKHGLLANRRRAAEEIAR